MKRTHEGKGKAHQDSGGGSDDDNATEKTFKRGPWTQQEDDLLIAYVTQHGEGNWIAVEKNSNLSRSGKSCRLRWMNHLRPNLKKGAFSKEEEQRVVELHAAMGNKWAKMTSHLPGRTDNEIKNFWNTRLKRVKRQGLPVYPDGVRERAMNAATQPGLNTGHSLDPHTSQESLELVNEKLPAPDFEFLHAHPSFSYYQPMITESFLRQRQYFSQPNMYNSIASSSGTVLPFTSGGSMNVESQGNMYNSMAPSSGTAFPLMGGRSTNEQSLPLENYHFDESTLDDVLGITCYSPSGRAYPFTSGGSMNEQSFPLENCPLVVSTQEHVPDIHWLDNDTYCSPSELSSFQYFGTRGAQQSDPLPPELESDNTLVQPPLTDETPSNFPSSHCDGLMEPVGYGTEGQRQATETDSEFPLVTSSVLAHPELPPLPSNTAGQNLNYEADLGNFCSTSTEETCIYFDADLQGQFW